MPVVVILGVPLMLRWHDGRKCPLMRRMQKVMADPKTTGYPLTFEAVQIMDDIRREHHCAEAICAYRKGCVCWDELLIEMKELSRAT